MDDVRKLGRLSEHLHTHFVPSTSENTGTLASTRQEIKRPFSRKSAQDKELYNSLTLVVHPEK